MADLDMDWCADAQSAQQMGPGVEYSLLEDQSASAGPSVAGVLSEGTAEEELRALDPTLQLEELERCMLEREEELMLREAQFEAKEFQLVNYVENSKDEMRVQSEKLQQVRCSTSQRIGMVHVVYSAPIRAELGPSRGRACSVAGVGATFRARQGAGRIVKRAMDRVRVRGWSEPFAA